MSDEHGTEAAAANDYVPSAERNTIRAPAAEQNNFFEQEARQNDTGPSAVGQNVASRRDNSVGSRPENNAAGEGRPGLAPLEWAEVRRVYELTEESVPKILLRFGLKRSELRRRREREGWLTRSQVAVPGEGKKIPTELIGARLRRLLRLGVARLERRLAENRNDDERDARTLAELIRAWDMMAKRDLGKTSGSSRDRREKKNNNDGPDRTAEIAWMRAELIRRLDRLRERNEPRSGETGD